MHKKWDRNQSRILHTNQGHDPGDVFDRRLVRDRAGLDEECQLREGEVVLVVEEDGDAEEAEQVVDAGLGDKFAYQ